MRIIAGKLGGRQFQSPPGHKIHPMSDKMRGALFNILGDIQGLSVLDAFAGSGALSFEAISRGAARATAVEIDKSAYRQIQKNIGDLQIEDKVKAIRANAGGWSDNNPDAKFDLVLLDPPYDDLSHELLAKLTKHTKPNGLVALSYPGNRQPPQLNGLELVTAKLYGDSQLVFYRKNNGGSLH
ncbi:16S rRNA (guanine(966)-N(2))-methyltransferase RsmD [Candidatus Saccharibacteria bacterium]|nr:16S rRNA (guanine(966)-N(2))-methyltransferase RsmD [Candidatus Saccharibacteria bacterium]